ncbi:unnamed protein product, partial [Mesorhabditis spiculigera]
MVDEFVAIKTDTQGIDKYTKAAFDANPEKNRYKGLLAYDVARKVSFDRDAVQPGGDHDRLGPGERQVPVDPGRGRGADVDATRADHRRVEGHADCRAWCWNNWPDRGVPPNFLACLRLINRVMDLTPIVVHCSAGIGSTGTIFGLEVIMARLQKGENCTVDKAVRELRDARHGGVQMDIQYVYIAHVLIALTENKKLATKDELRDWLAGYETLCKARGC